MQQFCTLDLLDLAGAETVQEVLDIFGDIVDSVEALGQVVIGVSADHGEDLCENFDTLARGNGDRATEAKQVVMSRLAVVDQHETGITTDVTIDTGCHRNVVRSGDELGLVTDGDSPEELRLALEVQPMHVVCRASDQTGGEETRTEVREATKRLDLEGTVGNELTGDLHVGPSAVTQVLSREQTGLRGHGLVVGTNLAGRCRHTASESVIQGLMEAFDYADDCGHFFLSLLYLIRPHGLAGAACFLCPVLLR